MSDERIEVEWIATANKMVQVLDRLESKFDKQEKQLQKIGDTSKKSAEGAANSFNRLEAELKENEAALKKMERGTKAFDETKKKVDQLRASLSRAKQELTAAGAGSAGLMSAGVDKLGAMVTGFASLQTVVSAIVSELDKVRQMRIEDSAQTRTVESAIAEMGINIGEENIGPARRMIEENAPKLGVTQQGLANMLAGAISGGAKDLTEAMDLSAKTLKLTAGDAAKAAPIMSGMLTLAATTGNRDFESTLGQLSQFQKAGRGENFAMSINNMATAIAAANTPGERIQALGAERTLELGATISQLLQDTTMAVTGTTLRQMTSKMDSFVPKVKETLNDGTVSKLDPQAIAEFNKLTTVDKRLEAMRANPEIGKQFLSRIEDNQGKSAIRALVTGSETALGMLREAEAKITPAAQAGAGYRGLVQEIARQTPALSSENLVEAERQRQQVAQGKEGQVVKLFEDFITKENLLGVDSFEAQAARAQFSARTEIGGQPVAAAAVELIRAQTERRGTFGQQAPERTREVGAIAIQQIEKLGELIRLQQEANDIARQNQAGNQRQPVPAARPKVAQLPAETAP